MEDRGVNANDNTHDTARANESLCIEVLNSVRDELYIAMRYMYVPLNSVNYVMDRRSTYMGCDGSSIYYNPTIMLQQYKFNPNNVCRAYLHMILHCMFRHPFDEVERNEELWSIACDTAVEYIIDELPHQCIRKLMSDYRELTYERLKSLMPVVSAQNIYNYLTTLDQLAVYKMGEEFLVDDHQFWKSKKEEKEQQKQNQQNDNQNDDRDSEQKQQQKKRWKSISSKVETALGTYERNIGDEKMSIIELLASANENRPTYRDFLRKFAVIREIMDVDMDAFDYGFYNYGMQMYGNMPLIEELEYKDEARIEDFVIVLDTSGSCSGELIQRFVDETYQILSETESFFDKINLHIIQCDNEVQEDICIHSREELEQYKDNFEVKGYGGTDFRPAFEYVNELIREKKFKRLNGLLYFTDGHGVYPGTQPGYKTAFIFVRTMGQVMDVPAWAMKLELDDTPL